MNQRTKLFIGICCCILIFVTSGCAHHKFSHGNCSKMAHSSLYGTYKIQNHWQLEKQIQLKTNKLLCDVIGDETTNQKWVLEQIDNSDVYRIRSFNDPALYLNIEHGKLQCSKIKNGWLSAQWIVSKYQGSVRIQNSWKLEKYLHLENDVLECSPIMFNWQSAKWDLVRVK